ncbi:hypothetical protein PanWU01x14_126550, partial [Parasponia andersonii]
MRHYNTGPCVKPQLDLITKCEESGQYFPLTTPRHRHLVTELSENFVTRLPLK